jgi:hypothetical protein
MRYSCRFTGPELIGGAGFTRLEAEFHKERETEMKTMVFAAVIAATASQSLAAFANQTGTIQPGGPRQGSSGDNFFNVEGSGAAAFASFGVARFDLTAEKAQFDGLYGVGNWTITGATLNLTESNASFSHAGGVNLAFSLNDGVDIKTAASPLRFDPSVIPGGNNQGASGIIDSQFLLNYTFNPILTGTVDSYSLPLSGAFLARLRNETNPVVTLVFEAADPAVAATYRGQVPSTGVPPLNPPQLVVAAIPAPGSIVLLGLTGLVGFRRRSR